MSPIIRIIPAIEHWSAEFELLRDAAMRAAPNGARVHHIGSTAVPGLSAKDIIDLQITVQSLGTVDVRAFALEGFDWIPRIVDHQPAGVALDSSELRKLFFRGNQRASNLHVREHGRFKQRYPLLCRDYLRSHPQATRSYELIKQRLAARDPENPAAYYEIKDPVFDLIMSAAEEWAMNTGWEQSGSD